MTKRMSTTINAVIAVVLSASWLGCASTRYMGRVPAMSPDPVPPPASLDPEPAPIEPLPRREPLPSAPRLLSLTPSGTTFELPDGQRLLVPNADQYLITQSYHGIGAIEGLVGGSLIGLVVGAVVAAKNNCTDSSTGCVSTGTAILATGVITGALGTLYGALVGHTTTYRWGPR